MHVGVQNILCNRLELEFLARHGVTHMDARVAPLTLPALLEARQAAAAHGISLDMVHVLPSRAITEGRDGEERERDIEEFCGWIEVAGRAGLRGLNYSFEMTAPGHADGQSTTPVPGRGGTSYRTFKLDDFDNSQPVAVTRDVVFARMQYFLDRVIPTAERWSVQLACHPDDPPAPVLQGVEKWGWPVQEGYERFCSLVDSKFHGLNLCCGTTSQGLDDPATELAPLLKHFAGNHRRLQCSEASHRAAFLTPSRCVLERGKIFNMHFRNIFGGLHNVSAAPRGVFLRSDNRCCCSSQRSGPTRATSVSSQPASMQPTRLCSHPAASGGPTGESGRELR